MDTTEVSERLAELSQILWRERQRIEVLVYRLEMQQLVLAAGRSRWLELSAREVQDAIEDIGDQELLRAARVAALAPLLGLGTSASLSELAAGAPAPWQDLLRDHQAAFLALVASAEELSRENRSLLLQGLGDVHEFLGRLGQGSVDGYSPRGVGTRSMPRPALVDREA